MSKRYRQLDHIVLKGISVYDDLESLDDELNEEYYDDRFKMARRADESSEEGSRERSTKDRESHKRRPQQDI